MTASMLTGSITPLIQGFLLCASIIVAFGPQNLFILRQGLQRQHVFATALFSTFADIVLISLGVGGLSALLSTSSIIHTVVTAAGVLFLLWNGSRALYNASRRASSADHTIAHPGATGILTTIVAALSFSFLNPSAYLDTIVIIGSKSLVFPGDQRLVFGIGAVLASTFWFFTLAYGASKLAPIFRSQAAWRTLDIISGIIMLGIASTMFAATCLAL
ncbi:MAG: LysE/ArgO family amino acid transporter [Chloroflexota bacterium]